jgi:hypothetical protein
MKAWHNQHINNGEAEMAKTQILHRYTGAVLFECEVPAEHSGMAVRYALEKAVADGASLDGASLRCASLDGASLDGATLDGASLDGASLRSASLDGEILTRTPLSINHTTWPILITEGYMRIGCQRHTHAEWAAFDDDAIARMESRAPAFWDQWREPLMAMCKAHANIN